MYTGTNNINNCLQETRFVNKLTMHLAYILTHELSN